MNTEARIDLKVELARHRKTGREVAAAMGMTPPVFSRLLNGQRGADPALIAAIMEEITGRRQSDGAWIRPSERQIAIATVLHREHCERFPALQAPHRASETADHGRWDCQREADAVVDLDGEEQ